MADDPSPVDYWNPRNRPEPVAAPEPEPERPAGVIPLAFDAELSRSTDHAAIAAIETALRAMKIATFRAGNGGGSAKGDLVLYVNSADLPKAQETAARIFARRARVRKMAPRREPVGEESAWGLLDPGVSIDPF